METYHLSSNCDTEFLKRCQRQSFERKGRTTDSSPYQVDGLMHCKLSLTCRSELSVTCNRMCGKHVTAHSVANSTAMKLRASYAEFAI